MRSGEMGNGLPPFSTIVGIGHSYGTGVLTGASGGHPDAWDALVLTGDTGDLDAFAEIGGMGRQGLANEVDLGKWGYLSGAWTATMNQRQDQALFLHYPNYTDAALQALTDTKGETSIGQSMTTGLFFSLKRPDYHKPTLIVTGAKDQVACEWISRSSAESQVRLGATLLSCRDFPTRSRRRSSCFPESRMVILKLL